MQWRLEVQAGDLAAIRNLVEGTGYFRPDEVDVAVELVEAALKSGAASGYAFIFAEDQGRLLGYCCYGRIACTLGSYDLYWIAVDRADQGRGLGRQLMAQVEQLIWSDGGRHIYVETSGREQYAPTRAFYARCGYETVAVLPDFYDVGDDKVVLRKCR